jgi:hypothetical protein
MIANAETLKAAVTLAEMARMVGLSPQRFQQLKAEGVFPWPVYDIETRRPAYTEELQRLCLEVRGRNCGINGRPVLFYARRSTCPAPPRLAVRRRVGSRASAATGRHVQIVEALKSLGIEATAAQVGAAVEVLYPTGVRGTDEGEVIRRVFLHLRHQNSADNVRR